MAERFLTLASAVNPQARMGHLDAQGVDARDEPLRFFHAVFETLIADEPNRFHQRAGSVAQQHPINGVVDVGLQAGGVQKGGQVSGRCQAGVSPRNHVFSSFNENQGVRGVVMFHCNLAGRCGAISSRRIAHDDFWPWSKIRQHFSFDPGLDKN
ncbi:MAG: hypothetical protein ABSC18_05795 [Verrucomicrobiota bacterium]